MKNKFLYLLAVIFGVALFTSCENEEALGRAVKGTWEGDLGITRTLRGKTIKPTRTVIHFDQETNTSIVGSGVMIEYYNLPGLEAVYNHITWESWQRKNGNPGFEFRLDEDTSEKYVFYDDWSITDEWFEGIYPDKDGKDIHVRLTRINTMPDISNVKMWGFYDNMDTWHPVTYEGTIGVKRDYQTKSYTPTKVTIVFDIDPVYNESNINSEGYIIEHYADAPFGNYLADKIDYWGLFHEDLRFRTTDNTEYQFFGVKVNDKELTGEFLVSTNNTQAITLKRVDNPDTSTYTNLGIGSKLK